MKILIIDDHSLIREALRRVVRELKREARILEASTAAEALQVITDNSDIRLILLDPGLPDCDGFSLLSKLREQYPAVSVVVLSGSQDRTNVIRALQAGALGYIPKSAKREVMLGALRLIFSGGVYIPPEIMDIAHGSSAVAESPFKRATRLSPGDLGLSDRQAAVLALMMRGKNNKVICRALDLTESTVKHHVTAVLRALKANNRTEAVIAATRLGLEFPVDSSAPSDS